MARVSTPTEILEHTEALRRLAHVLVRDASRADDALQETLLRALQSPPRQAATTRPWLKQVMRNVVRKEHRRDTRRVARELATPERASPEPPDKALVRVEQARVLVDAVFGLSAAGREVVELRFFEGLPPRRIAQRLELPVETVKTRLKRALAELRTRLSAADGPRWPVRYAVAFGMTPATFASSAAAGSLSLIGALSMSKIKVGVITVALVLIAGGAWSWLGPPGVDALGGDATRTDAAAGGGPVRLDGRARTEPSLSLLKTSKAASGAEVSGRADAQPKERGRAPEVDTISGRVLVTDQDGQGVPVVRGTLHYLEWKDGVGDDRRTPVVDGAFKTRVEPGGKPEFRMVSVGARAAIVVAPRNTLSLPLKQPFAIEARMVKDTILRIVDGRTGDDLRSVFLQAADYQGRNFPHPGLLLDAVPPATTSPIRIPATFERLRTREIVYRVGAPGFGWTSVSVLPAKGDTHVVRLSPGGALSLSVSGPPVTPSARVRIRQKRGGRPVASYRVPANGRILCEDLRPGQHIARLEIGQWFDDPVVLGTVGFQIAAEQTTEAHLETSALEKPDAALIAGTLHVPAGWPLKELLMTIALQDTPLLGGIATHQHLRIGEKLKAVPEDPRQFRFNLGRVQAGLYEITIRSFHYTRGLAITVDDPDLEIRVPPRVKVSIDVEGDVQGRAPFLNSLVWHCKPGPGVTAWGLKEEDRTGAGEAFEFFAPATTIRIRSNNRAFYGEPFLLDVPPTGASATFRVRPTCHVFIEAIEGEKRVPWSWDWPWKLTPLSGKGKTLTRGVDGGRRFADVSVAGRYRLTVGPIEGYAPIPARDVDIGLGEPTEVRIKLTRAP